MNDSRTSKPLSSPMLMGILMGTVLGLSIAGGLAWYLQKAPSRSMISDKSTPGKALPAAPATAASGVGDGKPRFEFYKVLTDKQDPVTAEKKGGEKSAAGSKSPATATPAVQEIYFLQAGSFSNTEDADKLKARLAMLGMEASVQVAIIPDKGTYHRVRLGPYRGAEEMNKTRAVLKQNGVEATPMRAQ